jgi:undecaprenyl-diphosphatase
MMKRLTHLGGARFTLGLPLLLCGLGSEARTAGLAALLANAASHGVVQLLKRTVARPRPCDAWGRPLALVELPDPFSFPSGHAAASFAVAVPIAITWPWTAPLALGLAAVISASRVILKVHHASDVFAGAALGIAGALGAMALVR